MLRRGWGVGVERGREEGGKSRRKRGRWCGRGWGVSLSLPPGPRAPPSQSAFRLRRVGPEAPGFPERAETETEAPAPADGEPQNRPKQAGFTLSKPAGSRRDDPLVDMDPLLYFSIDSPLISDPR